MPRRIVAFVAAAIVMVVLALVVYVVFVRDTRYANENQLLQSQAFNDVMWAKQSIAVSADVATAPDGTTTADKVVESDTKATHFIGELLTIPAGSTFTASIYVKAAGRSRVIFYWGKSGPPYTRGGMNVDLTNGTFKEFDSGQPARVAYRHVASLGDGWYRISMTVRVDATTTDGYLEVRLHDGAGTEYVGDITKGVYVWGAQVQRGARVGEYMATTTTARYDQPPKTGS
jgi:heme/copper-type cytochrome/quinol oxidase subunit 2